MVAKLRRELAAANARIARNTKARDRLNARARRVERRLEDPDVGTVTADGLRADLRMMEIMRRLLAARLHSAKASRDSAQARLDWFAVRDDYPSGAWRDLYDELMSGEVTPSR